MADEDPNKPNEGTGNGAKAAETFEASGAPAQVGDDVDPNHPAVDNDPRARATADQNRIDFNDPTLSAAEAVARSLGSEMTGKAAPKPDAKKGKK